LVNANAGQALAESQAEAAAQRSTSRIAALTAELHHTQAQLAAAKARFRELYVAELSMVEAEGVEGAMMALAEKIDPALRNFTPAQQAAYDLSHALRDSFAKDWKIRDNR
jgi:hypothetical protein